MQRTQRSDVLVIIPTHVTAGVHPLPSVTSPCLWLMGGPGTCVGPVTTGLPDRQDASLSPPGSPISTVVGPELKGAEFTSGASENLGFSVTTVGWHLCCFPLYPRKTEAARRGRRGTDSHRQKVACLRQTLNTCQLCS